MNIYLAKPAILTIKKNYLNGLELGGECFIKMQQIHKSFTIKKLIYTQSLMIINKKMNKTFMWSLLDVVIIGVRLSIKCALMVFKCTIIEKRDK